MDLKIKYNKDKSKVQVTLTVEPAQYIPDSKVYNTSYIVKQLRKRNIMVKKEQCVSPSKVSNYSGPARCTGTWIFSLPKPQEQPQAKVEKKESVKTSTPVKRTAPKVTKAKPAKKPARKKTTKKV